MTTLLRGATLVDLDPPLVERADLRIDRGKIVARAQQLEPGPTDEVTELSGRLVMPGLVSAHHHLHAVMLRGLARTFSGYAHAQQLLERIEDALTLDDVQAAAAASGLEGLRAGTTTVFALHASPKVASGSLQRLAHGLNDTGLRAVIAYELSDRAGVVSREEALEEATTFTSKARGRFRGAVAASGFSALSDQALDAMKALATSAKCLVQLNLAEDVHEEFRSVSAFGRTPLERLFERELITDRTLVSQGVHFSWPQLSELLSRGTWLAHAARSNMNTQTGLATPLKFGQRGCFGTDVMSLDALAEAQAATLRSADAGQPIDPLRFLANGHRLASQVFGKPIGPLHEGTLADLVVLDYQPPTPVTSETLAQHLIHGIASEHVESVMVDGMWRLWKRKSLSLDATEVAKNCREATAAVWARLST